MSMNLISEVRRNVPGIDGRSLQNTSQYPDSVIRRQIGDVREEVRSEFPEKDISFSEKSPAERAARYYALIRGKFLLVDEKGPNSISEVRRFPYSDNQLEYWRDKMIRALNEL